MNNCEDCGMPGEPGTTCTCCRRGVIPAVKSCHESGKTVWVIDEASASFDWFVVAETEKAALKAFKRMWNDWCRASGADPYYWGEAGDKWSGVTVRPVKLGVGYMDREVFRAPSPY